jgi:mono/diheme cytochrome c family protein
VKSRIVRVTAIVLGSVLAIVLVLLALVYALSARRLTRVYAVDVVTPRSIPADAASVAHGEHIARAMASCAMCHGDDLGGQMLEPPGPLGTLAAPNLTRGEGGLGRTFTDADWVRALRRGVHRDGTTLILMPSEAFVYMHESDVAALVAFLKQLPPVDRVMPQTRLALLGRALLVTGRFDTLIAEKTPPLPYPPVVTPGPTAEYGRYIANFAGCHGCHGFGLSGGPVPAPPGTPPATNLTPDPATGLARWTEADFERALRHGVRPDGRPINVFMPWPIFSHMTDDEVKALWAYLRSVPARQFGNK